MPEYILKFLPLAFVFVCLGVAIVDYLRRYRESALILIEELESIKLKIDNARDIEPGLRKTTITEILKPTRLSHQWFEYAHTLHDQKELFDGEWRVARSRATIPASAIFSVTAIVDKVTKSEFYKHLPGILTGVGIIGTFLGLLYGLSNFDTSDPSKISGSVSLLLEAVRDAFIASAIAISSAIVVTWSEKELYRRCIEALDSVVEALDELFDSGVGEEYLASLVSSAQENSKQTRLLKDSLVTDLKEMLQNLVAANTQDNEKLRDALVKSYQDNSASLGGTIASAIGETLKEPLEKMAETVKVASGDQGAQVQSLLSDVLVAFMDKLESSFGSQFQGLSEMLEKSSLAISQMEVQFKHLISEMQRTGRESNDAISSQIQTMMETMQSRSLEMNQQMSDMLLRFSEVASAIGDKGKEAGDVMAAKLNEIFEESARQQSRMAASMEDMLSRMSKQAAEGQQETVNRVNEALGQLTQTLTAVVKTMQDAQQSNSETVAAEQARLQEASKAVAEQMRDILSDMRDKNVEMNQKLAEMLEEFGRVAGSIGTGAGQAVEQIGKIAAQGQTETIAKVNESLLALTSRIDGIIDAMSKAQAESLRATSEEQRKLRQASLEAVRALSASVEQLILGVKEQAKGVEDTIRTLSEQTRSTSDTLRTGASGISGAASQFTEAGKSLAAVTSENKAFFDRLSTSSAGIGQASAVLSRLLADYDESRKAVQLMLSEAQQITKNVSTDAKSRTEMLGELTSVSKQIGSTATDLKQYLTEYERLLSGSFGAFGDSLTQSLSKTMGALDAELEKAVKQLGSGVSELSDVVGELSEIRQR